MWCELGIGLGEDFEVHGCEGKGRRIGRGFLV
jgi:hypothetical protein